MKIIVDEVPKMAYKCLFSNYDYGYHQCQLTKADCYLDCILFCANRSLVYSPYFRCAHFAVADGAYALA